MRIFDLHDAQGRAYAFEVRNILLSRSCACKIAKSIPGARIIRKHRLFERIEDFCEFEIGGERYVISEPFGDSSRYWAGPRHATQAQAMGIIRGQFAVYQSWRRSVRALVAVILAFAAIGTYVHMSQFIREDKCLDSGGRWNKEHSACER